MNLQFYLSSSQHLINGMAMVYARMYAGDINQRAPTGIRAPADSWNKLDGCCRINRRFETPTNELARTCNAKLDDLRAYIQKRYMAAESIEAKWLRETINLFYKPQDSILIKDMIERYCNERHVTCSTRRKMYALRSLIERYELSHEPLTTRLTTADINLFANYLLADHAQNSVVGRLKQLRAVLYLDGRPSPNPFENYTIPAEVYGTPIYLTIEERDYITIFPDLSPAKAVQRDIFIFQCHTGCRVADMYMLTSANIRDGWLVYIPQKTARQKAVTVEVPLSATAIEIINRYRGVDKQGRLLPFISAQGYNEAIRYVLHAADISRPVMVLNPRTFQTTPMPLWSVATSHTARKTFIQLLYSATPDKRLVASMTGHSEDSRAFARYSEISRAMKLAAYRRAEDLANIDEKKHEKQYNPTLNTLHTRY